MKKINSSPTKLTKRERKIERMRNIILDAACDLFSKKSFSEITMDQIADQAALSKATLYNYFPNKEAIYYNIAIRTLKISTQAREDILFSDTSGLEQVLSLSRAIFKTTIEFPLNLKIMRRFTEKNNQLNSSIEKKLEDLQKTEKNENMLNSLEPTQATMVNLSSEISRYEYEWNQALQKGIEDGSINTNISLILLNYYIFMIIFGIADQIEQMKIPLKRTNISNDEIINLSINLIKNLLENKNV